MKVPKKIRITYFILTFAVVLLLVFASGCAVASKPAGGPGDVNAYKPVTTPGPAPVAPAPQVNSAPQPQQSVPQYSSPTSPQSPPRVIPIPSPAPYPPAATSPSYGGGGTIGLAAGGAKDINNFRENIRAGYLPLPTDVTYEGLFYDYYFQTGQVEPTDKLFSPSYSYAVTPDPLSGQTDYYLSVGLNSGMKESDFQRKKLNLVIVLDISGSMGSPFDTYYYDQFGKRVSANNEDGGKSKIQIATESVVALMDHLNADDRFGMVVFNDSAQTVKPISLVRNTDMRALKSRILQISAGGGTNLDSGIQAATGLYDELQGADPSQYENRIIFLSDAMPNQGDTSQWSLLGMLRRNASNGIYNTFIGIGVDFNTQLIDYVGQTKGANYYSVHSSREFRARMYDEFDYMVTPLVFDLELNLQSVGWQIQTVYGSPEADQSTGRLMKVNTLFPSAKQDGETKGGIILLKLRKTGSNGSLRLTASYEDRNGNRDSSQEIVRMTETGTEYFQNDGIRKAVLLARYADLLKDWTIDERQHVRVVTAWEPMVDDRYGIIVPPLGQWERQSLPLKVSSPYRQMFGEFLSYFTFESRALNDDSLNQESDILKQLSGIRYPQPWNPG